MKNLEQKNLGQKNLTYSMLLAAVMVLFLVGYFIWMLPSLYVAYMEEQYAAAIREQHEAFVETGTYNGVQVKNPTACVSIKLPVEENYIELASKTISLKITASDVRTEKLIDELQILMNSMDMEKPAEEGTWGAGWQRGSEKLSGYAEELEDIWKNHVQLPVSIDIIHSESEKNLFYGESFQIQEVSENRIIVKSSVHDKENQYSNYMAFEKTPEGFVFSVLPVITPQMDEIRPVVMQSLPMLCAVVFVLVLIFSQIYSEGIVQPVYKKLQDINQNLQQENERQEMFLRASSHQLKTPVTAALLLTDGMINQIGKYKDTKTYLPKVKEQLLSMRRMIEKILSLHQSRDTVRSQEVCLYDLVQAQIASYRVAAGDKQLEIIIEGDRKASIWTDADILGKIIDNLLSNAVCYTPPGKQILISLSKKECVIRNEGVTVPQDILPHIFEPFVHGSGETGAHGLGLYIAAYYARMTGIRLTVRNVDQGVEAKLEYKSG